MPAGLEIVDPPDAVTNSEWTVGTLDADGTGSTASISFDVKGTEAGDQVLEAGIASGVRDSDETDNTDTSTITVAPVEGSVDPDALDFGIVRPGQAPERTASVTNLGDAPLRFVSVVATGGFTVSSPDLSSIQPDESRTYTVVATDDGDETGELQLTAAGGDEPALGASLTKDLQPAPQAPSVTTAPTIAAESAVRRAETVFTATPGTYAGAAPITVAGRWQTCAADESCADVSPAATGLTYTATAADVGDTVRYIEVATNEIDSMPSASEPSTAIRPALAAPAVSGAPTGSTQERRVELAFTSETAATFRCVIDGTTEADCSSPLVRDNLTVGTHSVAVRAIGSDTARSNATTVSWTVAAATEPIVTPTPTPIQPKPKPKRHTAEADQGLRRQSSAHGHAHRDPDGLEAVVQGQGRPRDVGQVALRPQPHPARAQGNEDDRQGRPARSTARQLHRPRKRPARERQAQDLHPHLPRLQGGLKQSREGQRRTVRRPRSVTRWRSLPVYTSSSR